MMENQTEIKSQEKPQLVKIDFQIPVGMNTAYATEMAVQTIHTEFILSFFELKLPLLQAPADADKELELPTLPATCVARVVMSVEKIPAVIAALQSRLDAVLRDRSIEAPVSEEGEKSK